MPLAGFPKGNIGLPFDPALGLGAIDIDAEDEGRIRAIRNIYGGSSWVRVGKKSKPSLLRTSRPGSRETESQAAGTTGIGPVLLGADPIRYGVPIPSSEGAEALPDARRNKSGCAKGE